MRGTKRRSPRTRLILTLAALASLIGGYYAGQHWQRRPLADLSAIVFPNGLPVDYPAAVAAVAERDTTEAWRLFVVADTRAEPCRDLLWHYAKVVNRLAAWPDIQPRLRLTVLAYDQPDAAAIASFSGAIGWAEVISDAPAELDRLSGQLGILPRGDGWCRDDQATAVLVAPDRMAWALIPLEQAAIMARNIQTIVAFVE